jgi:hypothetical protein
VSNGLICLLRLEEFWQLYSTKIARGKCQAIWTRKRLDEHEANIEDRGSAAAFSFGCGFARPVFGERGDALRRRASTEL